VANHFRNHGGGGGGGNRGRRSNNAPCAICKGNTTGFVPVYIDLGSGGCNAHEDDGMSSGEIDVDNDKESENKNDDDAEEKLNEEWDELWNELEKLCGYRDRDNDNINDEMLTTTGSSSSVVERRGDREIAQICIAIDLTQPSPPPKSGTSQRGTSRAEEDERKRCDKINNTLRRLKTIHHNIRNKPSCSKLGGATSQQQQRHLERLRAKLTKLQSDNSELHRTNSKLQESNTALFTQFTESEKISSDFTVEMERSKLKYESLQKQHQQSQNEIARLMAQYNNEKSTLTNTIVKLRQQNKELMEDVSLENIKELEEVRTRYAKMTQAVHDAKLERNKAVLELTRQVQELEGRYNREKSEHNLLKCRVEKERLTGRCEGTTSINRSGGDFHHSRGRDGSSAAYTTKVAPTHRSCASLSGESSRSDTFQQSRSSSNRALDALNMTSSRKFPMHLDQQPRRRHNHHQTAPVVSRSTSSSFHNEEGEDESAVANNGVQLLMRTGDIRHRSSKKRRSDDISSGSSHTTTYRGNDETTSKDGYNKYYEKEHVQIGSSRGNMTMNYSSSSNNVLASNVASNVGGLSSESSSQRRSTTVVVTLHSPSTKRQGGIKSYFKPTT